MCYTRRSSQGHHEAHPRVISTTKTLDLNQRVRITVIKQQLDVKFSLLSDMDKEILSHCDINSIPRELEESKAITANIITCKQKIDEVIPVTALGAIPVTLPPPVTMEKPHLTRLSLREMSRSSHHLSLLFTRMLKLLKWISFTISIPC